jgi:transcription elongation factor GreA
VSPLHPLRSFPRERILNILLGILLAACIARLWLIELPSSFWVDEMATVFVVHQGPNHPSLAVAPQVPDSIYYQLPRAAERLLGFSEVVYRLPSILLMGLALFLIARLAARLIHPGAAWFVVFVCLGMRGVNDQAADARPYALGTCLAAASLWFLIRWLDSARWWDAALFILLAALLWRVHLLFWPFYIVLAVYTLVRFIRNEAKPGWMATLAVFALIGVALIPVVMDALGQFRHATSHVIVALPTLRDLQISLKLGLILICGAGGFVLARLLHWPRGPKFALTSSSIVIAAWWLLQPLALFAVSRVTGSSMFVARYLYLGLPGAALAATLAAAWFIPPNWWKPLSVVFALGVLLWLGQWREPWPMHHGSNWRLAAHTVDQWASNDPSTPVLCPSPFIEARPPVWQPSYALPGFLYCHLPVYRFRGKPYLLPFESSPEARQYVDGLTDDTLATAPRFLIYGGSGAVRYWRNWFSIQPRFSTWRRERLGSFGDVVVELFEKPPPPPRQTTSTLRIIKAVAGMLDLKKKLEDELAALETELRVELPREISKARAHGDLSENAEYHAAKERQGIVNMRLGQLRARLRTLSMVDMSRIPRDRVGLGSWVTVLDLTKDEEVTYQLLTSEEADVTQGRISTTSPIGKALLGKQVGDSVKVMIPGGTREMEITKLVTIHDDPA